jgi:hypothetical protein
MVRLLYLSRTFIIHYPRFVTKSGFPEYMSIIFLKSIADLKFLIVTWILCNVWVVGLKDLMPFNLRKGEYFEPDKCFS